QGTDSSVPLQMGLPSEDQTENPRAQSRHTDLATKQLHPFLSWGSRHLARPSPPPPLFICWGCRILSGSVLIGAGFWVYLGSRRVISRGIASSVGNIVQLVFAASEYLLCCGVIILADPFGKLKK
uniref:Distal membrane-arm assembly complex protein 1-like domain-containing protein n=1 Tax=Chrysemys picta bellii TaxID=8478 RepID=A0A8C3HXR1_CHRPI